MNDFITVGKLFIFLGIFFILIGIFIIYGSKLPLLGRLPGDIHIKKDNFDFYFPVVTCILISVILTLLFYLIEKLR